MKINKLIMPNWEVLIYMINEHVHTRGVWVNYQFSKIINGKSSIICDIVHENIIQENRMELSFTCDDLPSAHEKITDALNLILNNLDDVLKKQSSLQQIEDPKDE